MGGNALLWVRGDGGRGCIEGGVALLWVRGEGRKGVHCCE